MTDELKKEFTSLCWGLKKTGEKWEFFWAILDDYPENYQLFKEKISNLLILLNQNEADLLQMDIEDEIWDLI
ncbi:hypothetical protein EBS02_09150 [bacterium]|jgi:hypothetical protein|nr:hypothetical protein [bacterium]